MNNKIQSSGVLSKAKNIFIIKISVVLLFLFCSFTNVMSQSYNILTNNGETVNTCSATLKSSTSCAPNVLYTMTFCSGSPDQRIAVSFVQGYLNYSINANDHLYMYDGPDVSSPLMHDKGSGQSGYTTQTSGTCMTIAFITPSSSTTSKWSASIKCMPMLSPPSNCGENIAAADHCKDSPLICNLNGYCGNTSDYYTSDLPGNFCEICPDIFGGSIQNNSWLSFIADTTSATFEVKIFNCTVKKQGVQIGIYSGADCNNFQLISDPENTAGSGLSNANTTLTLTVPYGGAPPLVKGQYYYFMIDGLAGDVCDYTVKAISGVFAFDAGPNQTICRGNAVPLRATGGKSYKWSNPDGSLSNENIANPTAKPTVTTTYKVTFTGGSLNCPQTAVDSVTITVVPNPTLKANKDKSIICRGDTVTFHASGDATSFSWSPNTVTKKPDGSYFAKPLVTTTYTLTAANTANGKSCTKDTSFVITVHPSPKITFAADTICKGKDAVISALVSNGTAPYKYKWQSGETDPVITVNSDSTSTYSLTVTDANNCITDTTIKIIIYPRPLINLGPDQKVCVGVNVILKAKTTSGKAPFNFKWSTNETDSIINVKPSVSQTYTVTVTDKNNCTDTAMVKVTITNKPTVSITPPKPIVCKGDSIAVSLSGAKIFSWSPADGLNTSSGPAVMASPLMTTTYTINASDSSNCSGDTTLIITVNDIHTTIAKSKDKFCYGDTLKLFAYPKGGTNKYSYLWSPANVTLSNLTVKNTNNTLTKQTKTYNVYITDSINCKDTANITFDLLPAIRTTAHTDTICEKLCNGFISLKVYDSDGIIDPDGSLCSYSWSNGQKSDSIYNLCVAKYTVSVTDKNNCTDTLDVNMIYKPSIVLKVTPVKPTLCKGDTILMKITGSDIYQWSPKLGLSDTTGSSVLAFPSKTTKYTIKTLDKIGCPGDTSFTLLVSGLKLSITKVTDKVCFGDTLIINASTIDGIGPDKFKWTPGNDTTPSIILTNNKDIFRIEKYKLDVTDSINCSDTTSFPITFLPSIKLSILSDSVCQGNCDGKILLKVVDSDSQPDDNGNLCYYLWNGKPGTKDQTALCSGSYKVVIADKNKCYKSSDSIMIPSILIDTGMTTDVALPLSGYSPLKVLCKYNGNNEDIVWYFGDKDNTTMTGNTAEFTYEYIPNADNLNDTIKKYTLKMLVRNSKCSDTVKRIIYIYATGVYDTLSNVVNQNNRFMVTGKGISSFDVTIFNRWGRVVYENPNIIAKDVAKKVSKSSKNDELIIQYEIWDGKKKNGSEVDTGTYFYILKATATKDNRVTIMSVKKGNITILK